MTIQATEHKRGFSQTLWYWLFRLFGWKAAYYEPGIPKFVVIVWPHTANFDFFIGVIFSRAYPMPFPHFFAKKSAFRGILGPIMRWVGGVPVDRSRSTNFVDQVAEEFARHDHFVIAITPEGTRSKTAYWKSGFYYIALAAKVPIVMATIDYPTKFITYGKWFMPSGDMDADLAILRANYAGALGRHPERMGEIRFRETGTETIEVGAKAPTPTAPTPTAPTPTAPTPTAPGSTAPES